MYSLPLLLSSFFFLCFETQFSCLSLIDNRAEENSKNENSSACWVICVLDLFSSIFALLQISF